MRIATPLAAFTIGAAAAAAGAAPVAAAGTDDTDPSPGTDVAAESESDLVRMLAMVPVTSLEHGEIYYVDMTLAWERVGASDDPDERLDAVIELAKPETFTFVPQLFDRQHHDLDGAREEVGFSTFEIERELMAGAPPRTIVIDETSVPVAAVIDALESNPTWGPELEEVETEHGAYFTWTPEPTAVDFERRSPLRPIGQSGQLAVLGDTTAATTRTLDPADAEAALATLAGAGDSALAVPMIAAVADAVAGDQVVQALILPRPLAPTPLPLDAEALETYLDDVVALEPHLGIALVEVVDADRYRSEILVVHPTAEAAATNADAVADALVDGVDLTTGRPLAELFPGADVADDGVILRVTLHEPGQFRTALDMIVRGTLFGTAG